MRGSIATWNWFSGRMGQPEPAVYRRRVSRRVQCWIQSPRKRLALRPPGSLAGASSRNDGWLPKARIVRAVSSYEPGVERRAVPERRPGRDLDLVVEADLVGRHEGRLRRRPGVEPEVIEPVGARGLQDPPPGGDVGRRVAREGKDGALERPAQEDAPAVDRELRPGHAQLAQAEADAARGPEALDPQAVQVRGELVPEPGAASHLVFELEPSRLPSSSGPLTRVSGRRCGAGPSLSAETRSVGLAGRAGLVADRRHHAHQAPGDVRVDLDVVEPDAPGGLQFEPADDPVPGALRLIRDAVGIRPTGTIMRLSTRIVRRCGPGDRYSVRSYSCGVPRPFLVPTGRSSSHTRVSQCGRSR